MRLRGILVFAASFVLASVALAQGSAPVFVPAADVKWMDLDPVGAPGVKIADMWGDHTKGAFGAIIKTPAGWTTPLHTHTNAFNLTVISGTFLQTPEGKATVRLGPGSYATQPGGSYKHVTGCDKASECMFAVHADGKFDLIPAK